MDSPGADPGECYGQAGLLELLRKNILLFGGSRGSIRGWAHEADLPENIESTWDFWGISLNVFIKGASMAGITMSWPI